MSLTQTPLFREIHWNSEAMVDGGWKTITAAEVGPNYAPFLATMQNLDTAGFPVDDMNCELVDQRITLGLPTRFPSLASRNLGSTSSFTTGESQIWACILHFQVLDLILGWKGLAYNQKASPPDSEPLPAGQTKSVRLMYCQLASLMKEGLPSLSSRFAAGRKN